VIRFRPRDGGLPSALLLLLAVCSCGPQPSADRTPGVVASVPTLAMLARAVHVDPDRVSSFLPSGANPHAFEPAPGDVRHAADARVLVVVGLGFDDWASRALRAVGHDDVLRVVASDGVSMIPLPEHVDEDVTEAHAGPDAPADPHLWLDPLLAVDVSDRIAGALASVDPGNAEAYAGRALDFRRRVEALDAELRERFRPLRGRGFVALHPAWAYFARRYGLAQGAVIELSPGREPGPRELVRAASVARERGLRAVFADTVLPSGPARVVAEQAGLPVVRLDPLGGPGVEGRGDYPSLLRWNAERIADALANGRAAGGAAP